MFQHSIAACFNCFKWHTFCNKEGYSVNNYTVCVVNLFHSGEELIEVSIVQPSQTNVKTVQSELRYVSWLIVKTVEVLGVS